MPLDDMTSAVALRPPTLGDEAALEALFDEGFGPGRLAKTSYRIRERAPAAPELGVLLFEGERLVGAALQHRVRAGESVGSFLGPFAVADDRRGRGHGPKLIDAAVEAARSADLEFVLLIGPQAYFAPLRFAPVEPGSIPLGAPVDPARLLIRRLIDAPAPAGPLEAP